MTIVSKIKKKLRRLKRNPLILLLWNVLRIIKQSYMKRKITDVDRINKLYIKSFGEKPNLSNPIKFTEKIQWLKLNYRYDYATEMVDKHEIKKIVQEKCCSDIVNETIRLWEQVNEINIRELPDKFVIKATHGSGMNLIVRDKKEINWFIWKMIMKCWLKQNIYIDGREWPYKNVKPRLICESYIDSKKGDLKDYKFFCFNGIPKYIQIDSDRYTSHKRDFYDVKWHKQPFQYDDYESAGEIKKPNNLEDMIIIAEKLAEGLPFVRVDLYDIDNRIIFGEMTFSPDSGFAHFTPEYYDEILGGELDLREMVDNE